MYFKGWARLINRAKTISTTVCGLNTEEIFNAGCVSPLGLTQNVGPPGVSVTTDWSPVFNRFLNQAQAGTRPGFLKSFLCGTSVCLCLVYVCLCVYAP